jgi:serine/threonine-protein kinase
VNKARLRQLFSLFGGALVAFILGAVLLNTLMGLLIGHGSNVEVPDLSGLTLREARKRLAPFTLSLQVKSERPSNQFAAGQIVSQFPKPLARVKGGRRIDVIVSTGVDAVPVPAVAGMTVREATFRLGEDALEPGQVVRIPSPRQQRDRIVTTAPGPGAPVARSQRIDLLVSDGPPPTAFVMPDFRGRDADIVMTTLQNAGLEVGAVMTRPDRTSRRGIVVDQTPAPGGRVLAGQAVDLVVAER